MLRFKNATILVNIYSFSPESGWPGTIIEISGDSFSAQRDENIVKVGGEVAIIVEAATDRLLVVASEWTISGPISVTSGGSTAESNTEFKVLPYPSPDILSQHGPPRFFHGPQDGTVWRPETGVTNRSVLVLVTYPTDHDPGSEANQDLLRNDLINRFDNARQYWNDASYGTTTWDMTYTEWLALPRERRFYFWQREDIEDARHDLFQKTARSLVFDGTKIYHGTVGPWSNRGWTLVNHPNPTIFDFLTAIDTEGSRASALRLEGNRLYVGTEAGKIFVYDMTNSNAPVLLGSIVLPGSEITAIDVTGTNLLVAGRHGGIHWVNASDPAMMTIGLTIQTFANWAMAAKVAGNRGYVGAGPSVRVFDLSGGTPVQIANVSTDGHWVTDIDVAGNTCAVSTDGDGLKVFEVTAGGILIRSTSRNALRIRQIKLAGNLAFLAANADGLVIMDLTNLGSPTLIGQLLTTKPCYNIDLVGNEAILALGSNDLVSVNVANPATPVRNNYETPFPFGPSLVSLQNALIVAKDLQDLVKDANPLFVHALRAWLSTPGNSLDSFQGVIVVVNGPFLRGQSWYDDGFSFDGDNITFNRNKGVIYIAQGAEITRIAHELGHWFGMWDIYSDWLEDGKYIEGTAAPWCLSGSGDRALFCAHQINDIMRFYRTTSPNHNVVELGWSPTSSISQTFDIVAHDATQNTDPSRIHILKLKAAEGLHYYVEVRQRPTGLNFDQSITIPPAEQGLVVVTRLTQGKTISNIFERPIMLFGELKVGEQVVDAGRNLIIKVESLVQERPLIYRVRLEWNQPIPGDPNGTFDTTITPWNTDTWETVDIWIDSPRNNPSSGPEYEFFEGIDKTKPRLNGDRPWVQRRNKIYARIRNTGPQIASDVYVTCYVTSPPGIGDNGQWAPLATKKIDSIDGYNERVVDFDWVPTESKHTCLKIAILPQIGEIEPKNNMAQENVGVFDSAGASSHQPIVLEAAVRSPFVILRKVDLIARGLPPGWHAVIDKSWVWVEGHGSSSVKAVVWTDIPSSALDDDHNKLPSIAYARIEGWTSFDHRYLPIGGFLAAVKAVKKVSIEFNFELGEGGIYVFGDLDPRLSNVPITIELVDERGNTWLFYTATKANGSFVYDSSNQFLRFEEGNYTVQVFVTAGGKAAEGQSEIKTVQI